MALTAAEQMLLELTNRARLDPLAEAARYGIDLNQGLEPGTLDGSSRQVLAPNTLLEAAAIAHSQWMLATDIFSHTGAGGSLPWDRAAAAGYAWNSCGENVSWRGATGTFDLNTSIPLEHQSLFLSSGHRENLLNDVFREVGLAQEAGVFTQSGNNFNASMTTELFGTSGTNAFVTGVVYADTDGNDFYSLGEGRAGTTFAVGNVTDTSEAAGGYALSVVAAAAVQVTGNAGGLAFSATLNLSQGNVKLDVVDGTTFLSSGSIRLLTGINDVALLGLDNLNATGNAAANLITGNGGDNTLNGLAGVDRLLGGLGDDTLLGGDGNDQMEGGLGDDLLRGGRNNDVLSGGDGNDRLEGEGGIDSLTGGAGIDSFVFRRLGAADTITDFSVAQGETLMLDDAIWGGRLTINKVIRNFASIDAGDVLFDFDNGQTIRLDGVGTLSGLAAAIDLI